MIFSEPARASTGRGRIRWIRVVGLAGVAAALVVALDTQHPAAAPTATVAHVQRGGPLGEADGAVPDGTTVFDDRVPAVVRLDPALRSALRAAATDSGIAFVVDSGWRSARYQEHLLRAAISKYGSLAAASRWVATPRTSAHVRGEAVDIGPPAAAEWLTRNGGPYGLCRVYVNEPWHFELRRGAPAHGCPAPYADPTHDPRMWR